MLEAWITTPNSLALAILGGYTGARCAADHDGFLTYFLLKEVKDMKDDFFRMDYQSIYEDVERKLNKESALQNKWQEYSRERPARS